MYLGLANRDGDICFEYVCSLVCLALLIQCCCKVEDPIVTIATSSGWICINGFRM